MAALRSSRCLSSTSNACYFDIARSFRLFGTRSALSCSSSASYSVRKLSPSRRSLNQNGRARGPIPCNSKARRRDVAFWAKAAAAERLAATSAALLFGFWSLVTLRINTIGNQVLKAVHHPDTATPFHFNPAHLAVGAGALLLLMTFGAYKWAKNRGTEKPVDVPIQRRDGIGTMNNIGNLHAPTDHHPINGARKGEALPREKTVNQYNFTLFNNGDGPNGTIISY